MTKPETKQHQIWSERKFWTQILPIWARGLLYLIRASFIGNVQQSDSQWFHLWIEHASHQRLNLPLCQPVTCLWLQLLQDEFHFLVEVDGLQCVTLEINEKNSGINSLLLWQETKNNNLETMVRLNIWCRSNLVLYTQSTTMVTSGQIHIWTQNQWQITLSLAIF